MTLHRFFERLIWLCMLPLVVLGFVLVAAHLRALDERRSLVEQSLAQSAARSIDQILEVRLASLELLARTIHETAADPREQLNTVQARRLARHYVDVHGAHVLIGARGGVMLLNTRVPEGEPLPPMPQGRGRTAMGMALANGSRGVGDVFMGSVTHKEMVALAVPLLLRHPQQMALISTMEIAEVQKRIESYALPPTWSLVVRDSVGHTIARLNASSAPPWVPAALTEGPWVRMNLTQAPWTVELHAPAISLMDHYALRAVLLLITLALTVGLAYWAGRLASRRLAQALSTLTQPGHAPLPAQDIDEVRDLRQQMLALQTQRLEAQERERQRIGLELHDDLQQRLAVVRHDVEAMQRLSKPDPSTTGMSQSILQRIDDTIAATRLLVNDLRPPVLDDFGVAEALRLLAQQLQASHGLTIDLHVMAEERAEQLPKPVATTLYRVTQEALNNVRKHAKASVVHVTLDLRESDAVALEIVDDGAGFEVLSSDAPESHGLRGMLERVQALRGTLKIESQPGEGTAILVRLPILAAPTEPGAAAAAAAAPVTPPVPPKPGPDTP